MRLFKKTVFWVLAFAVLGGAFYIFDKKSEEKKAVEEAKLNLFSFSPSDVTSFTISKKEGETVKAEREGENWVVTAPVEAPGDNESIGKFLESLVKARYDGVLFEKASDEKLEEMGLKDPYLTVELKAGTVTKTIYFGDKGPTHNVSFAYIKDDPRIFRINTDIRADADKGPYDMRDKTILPFDPTRVKSFEIRWEGGERIFVDHPAEGKWHAFGLPEGKTNFLRVMEMLVKLKKSEVKAFVDDAPADTNAYGLKKPRVKILFVDEKGVKNTFLVGERDKTRRGYFASRGGGKNVLVVEEDVVDAIPRGTADLEEKEDASQG